MFRRGVAMCVSRISPLLNVSRFLLPSALFSRLDPFPSFKFGSADEDFLSWAYRPRRPYNFSGAVFFPESQPGSVLVGYFERCPGCVRDFKRWGEVF